MKYDEYRMTPAETVRYCFIYLVMTALISYVFYDLIYAVLIFLPMIFLFLRYVKKGLIRKRKDLLKIQFRDMIDSIASALRAGYSIENAFYESGKDMSRLHGRDSLIVRELDLFFLKLENGIPLEAILSDFASRTGVEDISDFSEIFVLAKRNGGDFTGIIGKTVRIMREKDETEREISVILSGRKYEQRVMCIIPIGIIIYLRITSREFLSVLYHNPAGAVIMTACLAIYIASYLISAKLIDIRV
ncbi:MAG TPA: type II secretion system protein F [Lachnospiraceae bacterium]|nr:type II secretion system protein F [Lachnospiraceae bacterium]